MLQQNWNWFLIFPVLAGIAVAVQTAINGQLRVAVHSPLVASFISFLVGTVALGLVILITKQDGLPLRQITTIAPYKLTGGLLGAFMVTLVILSVQRISLLSLSALIIGGQLVASLVFDHFGLLGIRQNPVTITRVAGIAFLILEAYLIYKK